VMMQVAIYFHQIHSWFRRFLWWMPVEFGSMVLVLRNCFKPTGWSSIRNPCLGFQYDRGEMVESCKACGADCNFS
jgi:hypothetical protein